jgi:hypothetical protein
LLIAGPTLAVPISVWHHHAPDACDTRECCPHDHHACDVEPDAHDAPAPPPAPPRDGHCVLCDVAPLITPELTVSLCVIAPPDVVREFVPRVAQAPTGITLAAAWPRGPPLA